MHHTERPLIYDHSKQAWRDPVLAEQDPSFIPKGVIGIEQKKRNKGVKFVFGAFSYDPKRVFRVVDPSNHVIRYTLDEIDHPDFKLSLNGGIFYPANDKNIAKQMERKTVAAEYSIPLSYRCNYRMDEFVKAFNIHNHINENIVPKHIDVIEKLYPKNTEHFTYGIEYETSGGFIPEPYCLRTGMIPVKDGSLRKNGYIAMEYATIPMSAVQLHSAVEKQTRLLNHFCDKSVAESMHVHVGGIPRTRKNALAIYKIMAAVQDELYEIFPTGMKNTGAFKPSGMNYCSPLRRFRATGNLDDDYAKLYRVLVSGVPNSPGYEILPIGSEHPNDPMNNRKWNVSTRYKIVNIIPFIFGSNGTVEFRIHTPTFNPNKILMWIQLVTHILNYAVKYADAIVSTAKYPKITLKDIVDEMHGIVVPFAESEMIPGSYYEQYVNEENSKRALHKKALLAYIEERKAAMYEAGERGDIAGQFDIDNDTLLGVEKMFEDEK